MTEMLTKSTISNEGLQNEGGHSQYKHQTMNMYSTVGLVFMSFLAFALLVALLRQQARFQKLVVQLMQHR